MSLLTVVQAACNDLSLPALTSVVGNGASHAPLMLRVAKEELNALATRYEWQRLRSENTFLATATAVQVTASAVPADFDRMVNETFFNRSSKRRVWGPLSSEEWQNNQAHSITMIDPSYYFRGGTILLTPTPTTGHIYAYEYISTNKARSNAGAVQENWQADSDTSVFREDIVTLGIGWRYKKAKGYIYTADQEEYERRVIEAIMRDGTRSRIYSDAPDRIRRPHSPLVPDTITGP